MQRGQPVCVKLSCAVLQALMPRLANRACCWPKTETTTAVHRVNQGGAHAAKTLLWWSVCCLDRPGVNKIYVWLFKHECLLLYTLIHKPIHPSITRLPMRLDSPSYIPVVRLLV